jgi:cytochrome b6-f complex iron-sulfur subunit
MTNRRLSSFLDALAEGRRPHGYRAEPEDAEVLRTAIALRAARPGDATPDPEFVSTLRAQL